MRGDDVTTDLFDEVASAARSVGREWPGVMDHEDIGQEIWVRILSSARYVDILRNMDTTERARALRRIGHQVASQERDDYACFVGNVFYSTSDTRRILGDLFTEGGNAPGSEATAERVDAEEALKRLAKRNAAQCEVLHRRFGSNGEPTVGAMQVTRAVDALTQLMNRVWRQRVREW